MELSRPIGGVDPRSSRMDPRSVLGALRMLSEKMATLGSTFMGSELHKGIVSSALQLNSKPPQTLLGELIASYSGSGILQVRNPTSGVSTYRHTFTDVRKKWWDVDVDVIDKYSIVVLLRTIGVARRCTCDPWSEDKPDGSHTI
eukprot:5226385-Pyramimonas_sp.AAC.1